MKSLSQAEYGEIRDLYQSIYAPKQVDEEIEISDEELEPVSKIVTDKRGIKPDDDVPMGC